jgi:hypothetical protein
VDGYALVAPFSDQQARSNQGTSYPQLNSLTKSAIAGVSTLHDDGSVYLGFGTCVFRQLVKLVALISHDYRRDQIY